MPIGFLVHKDGGRVDVLVYRYGQPRQFNGNL